MAVPVYRLPIYETLVTENERLRARVSLLENFVRCTRDNWDHDEDAHRYDTPCRVCDAELLLPYPEGHYMLDSKDEVDV